MVHISFSQKNVAGGQAERKSSGFWKQCNCLYNQISAVVETNFSAPKMSNFFSVLILNYSWQLMWTKEFPAFLVHFLQYFILSHEAMALRYSLLHKCWWSCKQQFYVSQFFPPLFLYYPSKLFFSFLEEKCIIFSNTSLLVLGKNKI